ncbi:MAG TPA: hypothetical protein VGO57_02705 [Verrucomicrobiae bacterium]|jgi:O-antigen/teichoic acid export membrane protein
MDETQKSGETKGAHREYLRELFWHQLWQSANFLSKALFLLLMTPLMLKRWGADGYGLYALASSLLVSMALTDGGVRSLTRLRLTEALQRNDEAAFRHALGEGVFTFLTVLTTIVLAAIGFAASGLMQSALKLPPGGSLVLVTTVILTGFMLTTLLALEPLCARGKLSLVKAANTVGAVAAIPVCGGAVWFGGSVMAVIVLYSACMLLPNLWLIIKSGIPAQLPAWGAPCYTRRVVFSTLKAGVWYYVTTIALVIKTHALTFIVSALAGPAEAGIFYFMLRFTEIIGSVGASASETSLASLAAATNAAERRQKFNHSWLYVALFCLPGALVFAFQGQWILHLWFAHQAIAWTAGLGMAVFGLAGAFSRVVVNASMGLRLIKLAALFNLAEAAINMILAVVGYQLLGLVGFLFGGCLGILMMLVPAKKIATVCEESFFGAFIRPLGAIAVGQVFIALTQAGAALTPSAILKFAAIAIAGGITLIQLRRLHR